MIVKIMMLSPVALTEADLNDPIWRLLFVALFVGIFAFYRFFSPGHVKPAVGRVPLESRPPALEMVSCPECGSEEIQFDTLDLMIYPIEVSCKKCGHEWWYIPLLG